jgi:hypothetical protein
MHGAKRLMERGKYLKMGKMEGGSETPVLGDLNPPNNSKIPRRNLEIATNGVLSRPHGRTREGSGEK